MVTKETASKIWSCYHDIENGEKLLAEMAKELDRDRDPNPRDAFGTRRPLTLGIPTSSSAERLIGIQPKLAMSIIRQHIETKKRELSEANEIARIESQSEQR